MLYNQENLEMIGSHSQEFSKYILNISADPS